MHYFTRYRWVCLHDLPSYQISRAWLNVFRHQLLCTDLTLRKFPYNTMLCCYAFIQISVQHYVVLLYIYTDFRTTRCCAVIHLYRFPYNTMLCCNTFIQISVQHDVVLLHVYTNFRTTRCCTVIHLYRFPYNTMLCCYTRVIQKVKAKYI